MQKILYGRRVTLFPFQESDVDYFHFLLKHEGYLMGQVYFKDFESYFAYIAREILEKRIVLWTAWTKNGKASEKFGFIALSNFTPWSVEVHGFSDKKIMKGILKLLERPDKYTYAEDALRTILYYCFEDLKMHRVESECFKSNPAVKKLLEKVGFKREGLKMESVMFNENWESIFYYGLINEKEKENVVREKVEPAANSSAPGLVQPQPVLA